nr:O-sialoglycoprotein endopeptidase [Bacilli bacterium]
MKTLFIGIDTSNYTTSLCAVDDEGTIIHEERRILTVQLGERGLQQSQALYQHIVALPAMVKALSVHLRSHVVKGIAVSAKPREITDSFMPVFQAGLLVGQTLQAGTGANLFLTNHQAGHVAAGIYTSGDPFLFDEKLLVLHLSGGTTDVFLAQKNCVHFGIQPLSGDQGLHIGQFVDRIGVRLGLPFPAGRHLERMAIEASLSDQVPTIPSSVKDGVPSFSGPLSAALRLADQGVEGSLIAYAVFRCLANTLEKMIRYAYETHRVKRFLLVGGVASSQLLRERLLERFQGAKIKLSFCDPRYASDNAFGVALIAKNHWQWPME